MIDDLTCFRVAPDRYWLFPTPARVEAVLAALNAARAGQDVVVTNLGYRNAYLSIQGPQSRTLLAALTDADLSTSALSYYSFTIANVADVPEVRPRRRIRAHHRSRDQRLRRVTYRDCGAGNVTIDDHLSH